MGQLRKYRLFGLTLIDLVPTVLVAWIVHSLLWFYPLEEVRNRNIIQYLISLLIISIMFLGLGIIFHRMFGIRSALSGYLGFNKNVSQT